MPRSDEFEAGEPPARRRMSGADDRESDDRESDDRDDRRRLDELRRERDRVQPKKRSGAVTAVGILAIIFGGLSLICGGCGALAGAGIAGGSAAFVGCMQDFMKQAEQNDPRAAKDPKFQQAVQDLKKLEEKAGPTGWFALGEGIVQLLCGCMLLICGIGLLKRLNVCRYFTPAGPAIAIFAQLLAMLLKAILGVFAWQEIFAGGFWIVINFAFIVFAGFVLLHPKYAKEFSGES